ncbi:MAG: lipoate--protein ligase family protein [Gorillibacterium sp.]|nr:lipoate--protein ligase family protein [Gorillibacterium sp.]
MNWPIQLDLLDRASSVSSADGGDILLPFAIDELLCKEVGEGREPIVHLWRHPTAFVLGLRDRRLPFALEAMESLRIMGMEVGVRNSGGAAVPLDLGVVNVSVILPNPLKTLDFHQDFQYLIDLVKGGLGQAGKMIDSGEVAGAYCPGEYDLSIRGRKFCGIAQRRQTKAYIVQGFVIAEGSGRERARRVQDFYSQASGEDGRGEGAQAGRYPVIETEYTASLEELGIPGGSKAFIKGVSGWLQTLGKVTVLDPQSIAHDAIVPMVELLRHRYNR